MRKATYTIAGDGAEAELAITAFPGDVGGAGDHKVALDIGVFQELQ